MDYYSIVDYLKVSIRLMRQAPDINFNPNGRYTAPDCHVTPFPMARLQHPKPPKAHNNIREQRLKRGLSLEQLAEMCDLNWQALQRYETGVRSVTAAKLSLIAGALGVDPSVLIGTPQLSLDEDEQALIELVRDNPAAKNAIMAMVSAFNSERQAS